VIHPDFHFGPACDAAFADAVRVLGAEIERLRAEVAWLRTPILHDEVCAVCGHAKFHHHDYRHSGTANDVTKCWGQGFDRDNCPARCEQFVRLTHDGRKP
jgi:hypothetical protein